MIAYIFALLSLLAGIGALGWFLMTLPQRALDGATLLTLAAVFFLFTAALGIWRIANQIEDYLEDSKKAQQERRLSAHPVTPVGPPIERRPGDNRQ